ncbi:MAG: haloacid dehalogenase type II [Cyclobacteriaceae bacterium]
MVLKPQLLIFDVNETLLDLSPLKTAINGIINDDKAFDDWFTLLIQYALVETVSGQFRDFGALGKAALEMVSAKSQIHLSEEEINNCLTKMHSLPAHKEVEEGLMAFQKSGFEMAALTNGTLKVANEQLKFAKIDHYFDQVFSVEIVKKYKPHPDTYHHVLDQMNIPAGKAMLIAAHAWDITGAQRAGLQTCFIARPGKVLYPLGDQPTLIAKNLSEATKVLESLSRSD